MPYFLTILAKLTSKNQLTLPRQAVDALGRPSHFTVEIDSGQIVLAPAHRDAAAAVREKLAELGIGDADVADAVRCARSGENR